MVQMIKDEFSNFQDNSKKLYVSGTIVILQREECDRILQMLDDPAQGATGLLPGDGECGKMLTEVDNMIYLLTNLRSRREKERATTKPLLALGKKIKTLWA